MIFKFTKVIKKVFEKNTESQEWADPAVMVFDDQWDKEMRMNTLAKRNEDKGFIENGIDPISDNEREKINRPEIESKDKSDIISGFIDKKNSQPDITKEEQEKSGYFLEFDLKEDSINENNENIQKSIENFLKNEFCDGDLGDYNHNSIIKSLLPALAKSLVRKCEIGNDKFDDLSISALEKAFSLLDRHGQTYFYFPGGINEFVLNYYESISELSLLIAKQKNFPDRNSNERGVGVTAAIQNCLDAVIDHLFGEQGGEYFSLEQNHINFISVAAGKILLSCKNLSYFWDFSDRIWLDIGDKSTDFNYYSKRALLAWVWLQVIKMAARGDEKKWRDGDRFAMHLKEVAKKNLDRVLLLGKIKHRFCSYI